MMDDLIAEITQVRNSLLDLMNFDLFTSPLFIQELICLVGNLDVQHHASPFDGLSFEGIKVEVKTARATKTSKGRWKFGWCKLQGSAGQGKGADVFVLVGYDNRISSREPFNQLRFFVLPARAVGHRHAIDMIYKTQVNAARRNIHLYKWMEYEVAFEDLHDRIRFFGNHRPEKRKSEPCQAPLFQ